MNEGPGSSPLPGRFEARNKIMILQQHSRPTQPRAAFTLMEMLVVVAIIVALASLGGYYFMNQLRESQKKTAYIQLKSTLTPAVETYMLDHNQMVPDGLPVLLLKDEYGFGPYLKSESALRDPWGGYYILDAQTTQSTGNPVIYCESPYGRIYNQ